MQQDEKSESFPPALAANRVKVASGINDLGGAMLRLTFLLCSGLFLAMLLGGRDFGQLRPGLAQAAAHAKTRVISAEVPAVETVALGSGAASDVSPGLAPAIVAAPVIVATPAIEPSPAVAPANKPALLAPEAIFEQVSAPLASPEPENTVFTLSTYADPMVAEPAARETAARDESQIWYVDGNSVNVRAGPSTDDAVIGKLSRGEATLLVSREGEDWARIRIEGDGIEGYVAVRFLTPVAPSLN